MSENYEITTDNLKDGEGRTASVIVSIHSPDGTMKTAAISPDGMIVASMYDEHGRFINHTVICPPCWFPNENEKEKAAISQKATKRFTLPTVEEVRAYCKERGNRVDPVAFVSFYESNGWKVGRNAMKDWRAAVRTWEQREGGTKGAKKSDELPIDEVTRSTFARYARRCEKC